MPPSFIYPKPEVECEQCLAGVELYAGSEFWWHAKDYKDPKCQYDHAWLSSIWQAEDSYKNLLSKGWRPQEARSVFPNALASRLVTTGNLRNWRHFFIMRTTAEAHPQMRQVTIPLLAEFKEKFPLLFDDINPMSKQSESMKRMR
jgi:thymidylate synthase ThyX